MLRFLAVLSLLACQIKEDEIWFGKVHGKDASRSSCSHSYKCNCSCLSRDKDGRCTQESCDTCHHHRYDYSWDVFYDYNQDGRRDEKRNFKSCGDCSLSLSEKKEWAEISPGDSAAVPHWYFNYLLADDDSLMLNRTDYQPVSRIPSYPTPVGFHGFRSALNVDTRMNVQKWNESLSEINTRLGHRRQVHVMVVAVSDPSPDYADSLASSWKLGKKNNAIFVFGVNPQSEIIVWSRLISFSDVEMMRIRVRDDFPGLEINDPYTIAQVEQTVEKHFRRDPMSEKKYLITNTWWYQWGQFSLPLGILAGVALLFLLWRNNSRRRRY